MRAFLLSLCAVGLLGLAAVPARAMTPAQALAISAGDTDARVAALQQAIAALDPRVPVLVQALLDGEVRVDDQRAYIVAADGSAVDAATGQPATPPKPRKTRSTTTACAANCRPRWPRCS